MKGVSSDTVMTFGVLGPMEVRRDGEVVEIAGQRLRALLGLLAVDAGATVPSERLIAGVWEDAPPVGVHNALQALVSRLRAALTRPGAPARVRVAGSPPPASASPGDAPAGRSRTAPVTATRQIVVAEPTGYRLVAEPGQVDAHRFTELARSGKAALAAGDARTAAGTLRAALALWRGPALADLAGATVAAGDVARLENLRLAAAEDRIEADLLLGRYAEVVDDLTGLLAEHRLRERVHGQLMRALHGSGRRVEALAAYESARRTFRDELGADPSPELAGLHLALLRDEPRLHVDNPSSRDGDPCSDDGDPSSRDGDPCSDDGDPSRRGGEALEIPSQQGDAEPRSTFRTPPGDGEPRSTPGVPPVQQRRGNLRARLTSFVGRERDVAHAGELLAAHRLVTLLGPGGAGKTRLAMETAEALEEAMPDGVWLAELASAADGPGVVQCLIGVLDVRDGVSVPSSAGAVPLDPLDRLVSALRGKRLLVVLDNCEHVAADAAVAADRILAECPGVRILATSREPLGITGEITWILPPLAVPPSGASAAEAGRYPAVRLFADRAAAVRPGYRVDTDAAAVTGICRALDGLPLAIELAAARLRSMTAEQVSARLGDRFRLLSGGSRTAQPRHRTLRAVVEWSWELLDEDERVLGRRLAAFSGGASLETLEQVFGDVLDPLARLVDKSLVVYDAGRYRMLETIRAYAAERLAESGEEHAVRQSHARHFTGLAEEAEPVLRGGGQLDRLAEHAAEHDNFAAALRWALDSGDGELALRLVGALGWYWWLRGHRLEGALRAREVLAAAPGAPRELRALALAVHGFNAVGAALSWEETHASLLELRGLIDRVDAAHPLVAMATPILLLYGVDDGSGERYVDEMVLHADLWTSASGLMYRGLLHYAAGRIEAGERDTREALERYRRTGDRWGMGTALGTLCDVHVLRGDVTRGVAAMRQALRLMDELGAIEDTAYMRAKLALGLNLLGRRAETEELLREVQCIVLTLGDRVGEAGVVGAWGELARQDGDLEVARRHYAEALSLLDSLVSAPPQMVAALNSSLGLLAVQEGDLGRARRLVVRAVGQAADSRDAQVLGSGVIACAGLALAAGRACEAATLLGGSQTIRGTAAVVEWDHVRITADAEAALGADEFARRLERGRELSRDEVIALARGV